MNWMYGGKKNRLKSEALAEAYRKKTGQKFVTPARIAGESFTTRLGDFASGGRYSSHTGTITVTDKTPMHLSSPSRLGILAHEYIHKKQMPPGWWNIDPLRKQILEKDKYKNLLGGSHEEMCARGIKTSGCGYKHVNYALFTPVEREVRLRKLKALGARHGMFTETAEDAGRLWDAYIHKKPPFDSPTGGFHDVVRLRQPPGMLDDVDAFDARKENKRKSLYDNIDRFSSVRSPVQQLADVLLSGEVPAEFKKHADWLKKNREFKKNIQSVISEMEKNVPRSLKSTVDPPREKWLLQPATTLGTTVLQRLFWKQLNNYHDRRRISEDNERKMLRKLYRVLLERQSRKGPGPKGKKFRDMMINELRGVNITPAGTRTGRTA